MFELELDKLPEYTIKHPTMPFEVTIRPIPKQEEVDIDKRLKGNERVKISNTKRNGFRTKKGDSITETLELPDINQFLRNKLIAEKSWIAWNIKGQPCDKERIGLLFDNYYDTHATPIIDAYNEMVDVIKGEEEDATKN